MVYIEVMYSDLSCRRVPLEDIDTLPKDNILFIAVATDDPEKEGELIRTAVKFGKDHYAVCIRKWNNVDWILLCGWDDDDYVWRRTVSPFTRQEVSPPFGCLHVVFNGIAVPSEVWEEAKRLIAERIA